MSYPVMGDFRFWCQKVLPLVYDDSLSYYELLGKVIKQLNTMGEGFNQLVEDFTALRQYFDEHLDEAIEEKVDAYIREHGMVNSVNGKKGAVVLNAQDVGAVPLDWSTGLSGYVLVISTEGKVIAAVPTASMVGAVPSEPGAGFNGKYLTVENGVAVWKDVVIPESGVVSVNGKNGEVVLNAQDVGARASDWLPTAAQVGAVAKSQGSSNNGKVIVVSGGNAVPGTVGTAGIDDGAITLGKIANMGADKSGLYLAVDSEGKVVLAAGGGSGGAVQSVNGKTGIVVLGAVDVGAVKANWGTGESGKALVIGEDGSVITGEGGGAVASVNGKTGVVVLNAADVGALSEVPVASANAVGGIKITSAYGLAMSSADQLRGVVSTAEQYNTAATWLIMSKGTYENIRPKLVIVEDTNEQSAIASATTAKKVDVTADITTVEKDDVM